MKKPTERELILLQILVKNREVKPQSLLFYTY